jgi:NADH dehydrogenase [ubiquinone] 1 alpha subcomplex assembly factor 7
MSRPPPTPLARRLMAQIGHDGPMRLDVFMAQALFDRAEGYYATRAPLGRAGDFVTAPEVSQVFGELIGLWLAHAWADLGLPPRVNLIELGPGRGTMMADALRAARRAPGFSEAFALHLVELNPALRAEQAARLAPHAPVWHETLEAVPPGPCLIVANEFLDCLPTRQFVRMGEPWHEVEVGLGADGLLRTGLGPAMTAPPEGAPPDAHLWESAAALPGLIEGLAARLEAAPGRALFIDYGDDLAARPGHSVQALHRHAKVEICDHVGEADLTAHVDFGRLGTLARKAGLDVHGPATQGDFLRALGAQARRDALMAANPDQAAAVAEAVDRLIHPDRMGALFKVLCVSSPNLPPPAGL